ncbi:putative iron-regulated membrane protein [Stakelama sediminis]|uniref:Putative iron-regulated membrane protein n=2 Tax=Stakelama sediminis TaxID=463200 RepID=A0A840Z2W7_9SPHN|nr:putative iron-regulated membrane protein [Stakelama sediminis]
MMAPVFAFFALTIACTGLGIQIMEILNRPPAHAQPHAGNDSGNSPASSKHEKRTELGKWGHWLKQVHSGEAFGPVGVAISIASGLALIFFAASGFWMYLSMAFRRASNRRRRGRSRPPA